MDKQANQPAFPIESSIQMQELNRNTGEVKFLGLGGLTKLEIASILLLQGFNANPWFMEQNILAAENKIETVDGVTSAIAQAKRLLAELEKESK